MEEERKYLWKVDGVRPVDNHGTVWHRNFIYYVMATTLERAYEITAKRYPDMTFIKIIRDRNVDEVIVE
jgi:hypothetical protein